MIRVDGGIELIFMKNKILKKYFYIYLVITLFSCSRNWNNPFDSNNDQVLNIPTDGLVAYYPFNGNTNDESGNNRHGVSANITFTTDRDGIDNSAAYFEGNGFVRVQGIGETNSFSIALWYKTIEGGVIISTDNIKLYADKTNNWFGTLWQISNGTYTPGGNPVYFDSTWHHVVVTHDAVYSRIITYFDGVVGHNRPNSGYFIGNNEDIYIGFGSYGGNTNFIGSLDDICLYEKAINSLEVEQLFYNPK